MKKCFFCEKLAIFHVTEININGTIDYFDLCFKCAQQYFNENPTPEQTIDILDSLKLFIKQTQHKIKTIQCKCGLTIQDLKRSGKFGCQNCYEIFRNIFIGIANSYHGALVHFGKRPKNRDKDEKLKYLKKKLAYAIKNEKYEIANNIKKEIENLK